MVSLVELVDNLNASHYTVGSSHWVHVTYIKDPHSFFVRPITLKQYLPYLQAFGEEMDSTQLHVDKVVIFKSHVNNTHVRGKIFDITKNGDKQIYKLYALDYGFIEFVPVDRIYKPDSKSSCIPPLTKHCQLADCKPLHSGKTFNEDAIKAMKFYVGKEKAKIIITGLTPDKLLVHLINTCPDDIATLMALTGYSTLGYESYAISRMGVPKQPNFFYSYKQLQVGNTLQVRAQSGDSLQNFFVTETSDYKKYITQRYDFAEYCKRQNELSPDNMNEGLPVAVFHEKTYKYERAIIKKVLIPGSKAEIQLVDWGTTMAIDLCRMKPISSEYFFMNPAFAIYCTADETQAWDNGLHRFLYPGYEFCITIIELGEKFESPNIVNITPISKK